MFIYAITALAAVLWIVAGSLNFRLMLLEVGTPNEQARWTSHALPLNVRLARATAYALYLITWPALMIWAGAGANRAKL